jgi:hypothetical protein
MTSILGVPAAGLELDRQPSSLAETQGVSPRGSQNEEGRLPLGGGFSILGGHFGPDATETQAVSCPEFDPDQ